VAGLAAARKAGRAAQAAGRRSLQMAAAQATMMLKHALGRYPQVAGHARAIQDAFAVELQARRIMSGWAVIAAVNVRIFLADALRRMGRREAAQQACRDAYRELDGTDQMFSRLMVDFVQASLWLDEGRYAEAANLLRSALEACETHDVPTMFPAIVAALGGAMARSGMVGEAVSLLEKATADKVQRAGGRYNDFYLPLNLAIALAAAGRSPGAIQAAAAAVSAAARHRQRGHEAEALLLLGELQAADGHADEARASFGRAGAIGRTCAMAEVVRRAQAGAAPSGVGRTSALQGQAPEPAAAGHA
jgi:tetratricopeptide (TPR) repeat protein